jgi:hypothetical protein
MRGTNPSDTETLTGYLFQVSTRRSRSCTRPTATDAALPDEAREEHARKPEDKVGQEDDEKEDAQQR